MRDESIIKLFRIIFSNNNKKYSSFFLITLFTVNLYSLVSSINLVITFNKSYK